MPAATVAFGPTSPRLHGDVDDKAMDNKGRRIPVRARDSERYCNMVLSVKTLHRKLATYHRNHSKPNGVQTTAKDGLGHGSRMGNVKESQTVSPRSARGSNARHQNSMLFEEMSAEVEKNLRTSYRKIHHDAE